MVCQITLIWIRRNPSSIHHHGLPFGDKGAAVAAVVRWRASMDINAGAAPGPYHSRATDRRFRAVFDRRRCCLPSAGWVARCDQIIVGIELLQAASTASLAAARTRWLYRCSWDFQNSSARLISPGRPSCDRRANRPPAIPIGAYYLDDRSSTPCCAPAAFSPWVLNMWARGVRPSAGGIRINHRIGLGVANPPATAQGMPRQMLSGQRHRQQPPDKVARAACSHWLRSHADKRPCLYQYLS